MGMATYVIEVVDFNSEVIFDIQGCSDALLPWDHVILEVLRDQKGQNA